jgi:hypothetical protein
MKTLRTLCLSNVLVMALLAISGDARAIPLPDSSSGREYGCDQGMLSVNYATLLPVAIKAVQEQQVVIDRQEARLAALERRREPVMSSLLSGGGLGGGVALGLLPFGLFLALRRRGKQESL